MNPHTGGTDFTEQELDTLAWRFLGSDFTELTYAGWPIERRVDAYLAHHGMRHVVNDGDAYDAVLQHVLTNIGPALRTGVLANATWLTSRTRRHAETGPAPHVEAQPWLTKVYEHA